MSETFERGLIELRERKTLLGALALLSGLSGYLVELMLVESNSALWIRGIIASVLVVLSGFMALLNTNTMEYFGIHKDSKVKKSDDSIGKNLDCQSLKHNGLNHKISNVKETQIAFESPEERGKVSAPSFAQAIQGESGNVIVQFVPFDGSIQMRSDLKGIFEVVERLPPFEGRRLIVTEFVTKTRLVEPLETVLRENRHLSESILRGIAPRTDVIPFGRIHSPIDLSNFKRFVIAQYHEVILFAPESERGVWLEWYSFQKSTPLEPHDLTV